MPSLDLVGSHPQGSGKQTRIGLEVEVLAKVHDRDVLTRVEPLLQLLSGDSRYAQLPYEAPALDEFEGQIPGERHRHDDEEPASGAVHDFDRLLDLVLEDEPEAQKCARPKGGPGGVIEQELRQTHLEDARERSDRDAQTGDEFGDDERPGPVACESVLGLAHTRVGLERDTAEKPENRSSANPSDREPENIARKCRRQGRAEGEPEAQVARRDEGADREQGGYRGYGKPEMLAEHADEENRIAVPGEEGYQLAHEGSPGDIILTPCRSGQTTQGILPYNAARRLFMKARTLLWLTSIAVTSAAFAQTSTAPLEGRLLDPIRFRVIGPSAPSGRVWQVVGVASQPKTFYVCTAQGGVWRTTNFGATLAPIFDEENAASCGAVAVAPSDPRQIWVGSGEPAARQSNGVGYGIYQSTDGGKTWESRGLQTTEQIGAILVHPTDPRTVYVAAMGHLWGRNPERGVFRTRDDGRTWDKVLYVNDATGAIDLAMDPRDPSVVYASMWQRLRSAGAQMAESGPGSGIFKTTDGGDHWTRLVGGPPERAREQDRD